MIDTTIFLDRIYIGILTQDDKWVIVKAERTRRIEAIRWMLDDGVPVLFTKRQEVLDYIQALRDIPQTFAGRPDEVTFPPEPTYESI